MQCYTFDDPEAPRGGENGFESYEISDVRYIAKEWCSILIARVHVTIPQSGNPPSTAWIALDIVWYKEGPGSASGRQAGS